MGTKKIIQIVLMGVFILFSGLICSANAAEKNKEGKEEKVLKTQTKEVTGEISAIGKDFIAIIYERDERKSVEYEMLVPIDTTTKLERKKSLSELNIGDTIRIQCEDMTLEDASGEKKMERKAKVISFVSPAVKKPEPPRPPEPGEGLAND